MEGFVSTDLELDEEIYRGSMQQIIAVNLGEYAYCDFVIGTDNIITKSGFLYDVGIKFFVLYIPECQNYMVCDIFNLKFMTIMGGVKRESCMRALPEDVRQAIAELRAYRTKKFGQIDFP